MIFPLLVAWAHATSSPPETRACESLVRETHLLRELEKPRHVDSLFRELDLLGLLLPKEALPVHPDVVKAEWRGVDHVRFSLHKADDRWASLFVRITYLAGDVEAHRVEFKNWKERGLPSEARARRRAAGGWTVSTAALFDEGAAHHHLALNYAEDGRLTDVVVTTREPGRAPDVTRFVPYAARDAR